MNKEMPENHAHSYSLYRLRKNFYTYIFALFLIGDPGSPLVQTKEKTHLFIPGPDRQQELHYRDQLKNLTFTGEPIIHTVQDHNERTHTLRISSEGIQYDNVLYKLYSRGKGYFTLISITPTGDGRNLIIGKPYSLGIGIRKQIASRHVESLISQIAKGVPQAGIPLEDSGSGKHSSTPGALKTFLEKQ